LLIAHKIFDITKSKTKKKIQNLAIKNLKENINIKIWFTETKCFIILPLNTRNLDENCWYINSLLESSILRQNLQRLKVHISGLIMFRPIVQELLNIGQFCHCKFNKFIKKKKNRGALLKILEHFSMNKILCKWFVNF
jgi:hypothetical protein